MEDIAFDRTFTPAYGAAVEVAPGVRRLTAGNASPFTFTGTNAYLLGGREIAIIDPGPEDAAQCAALLNAVADGTVTAIVLTHSHRDHAEGVPALVAATGAKVFAARRRPRAAAAGGSTPEDPNPRRIQPDVVLGDGATIAGDGWRLTAIATPGHASDHLCFALDGQPLLFSGDHVMGWSTTVVVPPDGSMAEYMASLDRLTGRGETLYLPGHGGPVSEPQRLVSGLKQHRLMREAAIRERVAAGDRTVADIVAALYAKLDPRLRQAAGMSVFAHLEDLAARGLVATDGPPALEGLYRPA